jgi:hypothetical protein
MRHMILALGATALVLAACGSAGSRDNVDRTKPVITLTALDARGTPSFRSNEALQNPDDACAVIARFSTDLSVSVSDSGGVDRVRVRIYPDKLDQQSVSVVPPEPGTALELRRDGAANVIEVYVSENERTRTVVVDFSVKDKANIVAEAIDREGNSARLYEVRLQDGDDKVHCRG